MAMSDGARTILKIVVVLLVLAGIGGAVEFGLKTKYKKEYRRLVAEYDQQISVDGPEETARTLEGVKRIILTAAGRIQGKSWSEKEVDFFLDPAIARARHFLETLCARSENGLDLNGYRIEDVRGIFRSGLLTIAEQERKREGGSRGYIYPLKLLGISDGLPACPPREGAVAGRGPFLDPRKTYQPGEATAQLAPRERAPASGEGFAKRGTQADPESDRRRGASEMHQILGQLVSLQRSYYSEHKRYTDNLRSLLEKYRGGGEWVANVHRMIDTGRLQARLTDGGFEIGAEIESGQWNIASHRGFVGTRTSF